MDETRKISVRVKVISADFRRVLIRQQWKKLVGGLVPIFFILFIFGFYLAKVKPIDPRNDKRPALYFTLAVMPVLIGGFLFLGIWRQSKRLEEASEETTFSFDSEGLGVVTSNSSAQADWEKFVKIVETSSDFVLFPQKNIFVVLPKRFFADDDQIFTVKSFIEAKLGSKAKLKSY